MITATTALQKLQFFNASTRYMINIDNSAPPPILLGGDCLPAGGTQTTETERFRFHYILLKNPTNESITVGVFLGGVFSQYRGFSATVFYSRIYAAWGFTTSEPPTQPTSWTEEVAGDYAVTSDASGWFDNLNCSWFKAITVPAQSYLWLRVRGTSWNASAYTNSVGFKRGNVAIIILV
ncbi:MAG: hypothetical protein QXO02_08565 [Thermofilaceae archaeon]